MIRITIFMLLLCLQIVKAQWTTDYSQNTQVSSDKIDDPMSRTTSDGKTFIAFWKKIDAPAYYQMYVQLLDKDGNKLFGETGKLVNSSAEMTSFTQFYDTAVDKDNNFYIAFKETGGSGRNFVHKISPEGNLLWGDSGLALPADTYDSRVFTDSNSSNVFVTYLEGSTGNMIIGKYNENKILQWPATQTATVPAGYMEVIVGEGEVLSDGSFVTILHAKPNFSANSNLYAQRYNASTGAPMWVSMTKLSTKTTASNVRYNTVLDNGVVYVGYAGSTGPRFDSYLQRVNADGTLPWGIDGKDFRIDNNYYEVNTSIAMQQGSQYIWALSRITTPSQGAAGTYAQKFDKTTGDRMFTDNAKEVFNVDSNYKYQFGNFKLYNDKPVFIAVNPNYNISPGPIAISVLNDDGSFYFPNKIIDIATADTNKNSFNFSGGLDNNFIAVWQEERNDGYYAFAQNFDFDEYMATDNIAAKKNISIHPNPVKSYLNIQSDNKIAEVKVYNLAGQILKTTTSDKIDFSNFAKGTYLVSIKDSKGNISTQKVIKN